MERDDDDRAENQRIARMLREAADLLDHQGANPFRVGAYRRGADTIAGLPRGLDAIVEEEGYDGLLSIPTIGQGLAAAIHEMLRSGRWTLLERLRGEVDPEELFQTVPGIGPELAHRIHEHLHLDTLEGLEIAAHDGRLESVPGVGDRRVTAIRGALAEMLGRKPGRPGRRDHRPPVAILLAVDADYRRGAETGRLPTIAPRRFNPEGKAWLPILHTDRGDWHFTALYSNTARAHRLGKTDDWVVLFYYDHDHQEGQATVVTEGRGQMAGLRVVRGREAETADYYEALGELPGSR